MKLSDPRAKQLLANLRDLLKKADRTFEEPEFRFDPELLSLPGIIRGLFPFMGRQNEPVPFWKAVVALDRERPSLALVLTLDEMVKRATSIAPGPVMQLAKIVRFPPDEAFLAKLLDALATTSELPAISPDELVKHQHLFDKIGSATYRGLMKRLPMSAMDDAQKKLLAYAGYLDLCRERAEWNRRYWPALEGLFDLLIQFDNEHHYSQFAKVAHGELPCVRNLIEGHKALVATLRQQRHRSGDAARSFSSGVGKSNLPGDWKKRLKVRGR